MLKSKIILALILCSTFGSSSLAAQLVFDGNMADGTEKYSDVKSIEFVIRDENGKLWMCGLMKRPAQSALLFQHEWDLKGSEVQHKGKNLGSYYDGNLMLEQALGPGQTLAIFITRFEESFFEMSFTQSDSGLLDADGWLRTDASAELKAACQL